MQERWEPTGLATGIGSLPCGTGKQALKVIEQYVTAIPHWPQLPLGEVKEGFVEQSAFPLMEFGLLKSAVNAGNQRLYFDTTDEGWSDHLTDFYSTYLAAEAGEDWALEKFAFPRSGVLGFYAFMEEYARDTKGAVMVKGQVSGPATVGFVLTDQERKAAYYDAQLRDLVVKTVQMQAKWQTRQLKTLGLPVLVSIDDPGLYACGMSTHITLTKEMLQEDLNSISEEIHREGGLAGVHVCAGCNWSIILDSVADVLFMDSYEYFDTLLPFSEALQKFFDRGGVIGWGIVPTSDKIHGESVDSLDAKLQQQVTVLAGRGIPREQLISQALLTPSCGTGLLSREISSRIYQYTAELSERWRKKSE